VSKHPRSDKEQISLLFINPHGHHSFFTALALSKIKPVQILCPALSLQLWRGYWRRHDLQLASSSPRQIYAQILALFAHLGFKAHWLSEEIYHKIFRIAAQIFLSKKSRKIVVYYQDYLYPLLSKPNTYELRICELIIDSNPEQHNWTTTLAAAKSADVVVAPNMAMAETLFDNEVSLKLVPYGGDKRNFLAAINKSEPSSGQDTSKSPWHNQPSLRIAARANSYRKGADLLLDALLKLNKLLIEKPVNNELKVQIAICGSLDDSRLWPLLENTQNSLSETGIISITAQQYSQAKYLNLLTESDCFLMPSRLESSSLAALEALWNGVPSILSTNCGVEQFRSGQHGLIIESLTGESIATTLHTILSEPEHLQTWKHNLAKDQNLFGWDRYFQAYKVLLENSKFENSN